MLRKATLVLMIGLLALVMAGFAFPASAETQGGSIPWWAWLLIVVAFLAFLGIVVWWCLSTPDEAAEVGVRVEHAPEAPVETIAPAVEIAAPEIMPEAPLETIAPAVEIAAPEIMPEAPGIAIEAREMEDAPLEVAIIVPEPEVELAAPEVGITAPELELEAAEPDVHAPTVTIDLGVPEVERPTVQVEAPPLADNLKRIAGIGPKIAGILEQAGITTFAQLAASDADRLNQILEEADPNLLRLADPAAWLPQARLAARGRWDELQALRDGHEPSLRDDLKVVEGIGPKIEGVLRAAGIRTFAELAATPAGRIEEILAAESTRLASLADPTTWPEQARLAAEGQWAALERLQDELKGGRREGPQIE